MKQNDIISQEKIDLLNKQLDKIAIEREELRPIVPMIKLTFSTIERKTEKQVGILIMSLFHICCVENQRALIDILKQDCEKSMYNAISD